MGKLEDIAGITNIISKNELFELKKTLPSKSEREKYRKTYEEIADKIHPKVGKILKILNNIDDTIENFSESIEHGITRALIIENIGQLELADHLFTQAFCYTHHGIYVGNKKVLHYAENESKITIIESSLELFANGRIIHKKDERESPLSFTKEDAVKRAYSRFYEQNYNLLANNCENFVRWCRNGSK